MHLIEVVDARYKYAPVVAVIRDGGEVESSQYNVKTSGPGAQLAGGGHLFMSPVARLEYFERKEPFNFMKLVFSPYGLMGLMAFMVIFVMPRMPKPDKAQMNEMMGQQKQ